MTDQTTTTSETSLTIQLGFDYGQLGRDDGTFVQTATDQIHRLGKQTVENIIEIGGYLTDVRERLPHGLWIAWLKAEFSWEHVVCRQLHERLRSF